MNETKRGDLNVLPKSVVLQAARQFAKLLGDTPRFREFEQAQLDFRKDTKAQTANQDFQTKQASLKALLALNAVSDEDRMELQKLQDQFYHQPSVLRYIKAQEVLVAFCQEIGDQLSKDIGLDFAASCKTGGCCG